MTNIDKILEKIVNFSFIDFYDQKNHILGEISGLETFFRKELSVLIRGERKFIIKKLKGLPTGMFDSTPYKDELVKSLQKK